MKKASLLGAVCTCIFSTISISAHAIGVSGQGPWDTTLLGRDLDGTDMFNSTASYWLSMFSNWQTLYSIHRQEACLQPAGGSEVTVVS